MADMDDKLEKRKLDALKRGIHRIGKDETLPFTVNLVGVGKAGAEIIAATLKALPADGPKMCALAVDIGDQDLAAVREAAAALPAGRATVETIALEVPSRDDLFQTLRRYREFLKLEYPRYYWNPNYEAWLPPSTETPKAGGSMKRAYAKALYGRGYYDGDRAVEAALRKFGADVDAERSQSVVCMIFGANGGTGSGIMVDLARHLSNVVFGRRALSVGIAILPCEGDTPEHRDGSLFATINELDCMGDGAKNDGVMAVWGDLDRNPFTGGVILVPQAPTYEATKDLAATHKRVDEELAAFLTNNNGTDLWETLRLLNWVGAPPTQHSAARTAYGTKWAHMFAFADIDGPIKAGKDFTTKLGLLPGYQPTFIEPRSLDEGKGVDAVVTAINGWKPSVPAVAVKGGKAGSVQFVMPCVAKQDLADFYTARDLYDTKSWENKLLDHSWLLDLGVMLCEPAIRFEGMAGECLWGCACWVVVPYDDIRGNRAAVKEKAMATAAE